MESPSGTNPEGRRVAYWVRAGLASACIAAVAGCQAFSMGNPFLPRARLTVVVEDPQVTVTITPTSATTFTYTASPQVTRFHLQPVQNDLAPAAQITSYSIQWFDINGATISPSLIPVRTQGISVMLPRGQASVGGTTGGTTGSTAGGTTGVGGSGFDGEVDIPVITNDVTQYGFDNGYTTDPVNNVAVPRTDQWSQYLTGKVTFSGRDENGWPIVGPDGSSPLTADFTLQFVTQASGSASGPTG